MSGVPESSSGSNIILREFIGGRRRGKRNVQANERRGVCTVASYVSAAELGLALLAAIFFEEQRQGVDRTNNGDPGEASSLRSEVRSRAVLMLLQPS